MKRICVYCGSSPGRIPAYAEAARALARTLVNHDIALVYGGASIGVMGIIADTVLHNSGEVIGVIPEVLTRKEVVHEGLSELHRVESMHERKALMAELADAFIALPGGFGTLEELFEIITWTQLGLHQKPIGLLNIDNYYTGLMQFLRHASNEQFIHPDQLATLYTATEAEDLLKQFQQHVAVPSKITLTKAQS